MCQPAAKKTRYSPIEEEDDVLRSWNHTIISAFPALESEDTDVGNDFGNYNDAIIPSELVQLDFQPIQKDIILPGSYSAEPDLNNEAQHLEFHGG